MSFRTISVHHLIDTAALNSRDTESPKCIEFNLKELQWIKNPNQLNWNRLQNHIAFRSYYTHNLLNNHRHWIEHAYQLLIANFMFKEILWNTHTFPLCMFFVLFWSLNLFGIHIRRNQLGWKLYYQRTDIISNDVHKNNFHPKSVWNSLSFPHVRISH